MVPDVSSGAIHVLAFRFNHWKLSLTEVGLAY
jgi:hypothetical protein